jgi:hypothetical protein
MSVSSSRSFRLNQVLSALGTAAVLTIGEAADFAESGGVIGFVQKVNTLGFVINPQAATALGLRLEHARVRLADRVLAGKSRR